ncbi:MAG: right-handed parallel beta-helix repeat-containing protein [Pseudomonadota bacterium]
MAEISCAPTDGWLGIRDCLAQAREGDTVRLAAGDYQGNTTLTVAHGVTLQGEVGCRLRYTGDRDVLVLRGQATIADLSLAAVGPEGPATTTPTPHNEPGEAQTRLDADRAVDPELGFDKDTDATAADTAAPPRHMVVIEGDGVTLRNCELLGNDACDHGIFSVGWRGLRVTGCVVLALREHGFYGRRNQELTIEHTRFGDNGANGIFVQACELTLRQSQLTANRRHGLSVAHDPEASGTPSSVQATDNLCADNTIVGIVLWSSRGHLENNECRANDSAGIVLHRDPAALEVGSEAQLLGNRCHGSANGSGIALLSSRARLENNECWGNERAGIALQRDPDSLQAPSEAEVVGNRCHDNRHGSGIVILSSKAHIEDNECWANGGGGIALQRDPASPEAAAEAEVIGNRCYQNLDSSGIILFSSQARLENNHCWENAKAGIALQRDSDSPEAISEADVVSNRCHDHPAGAGIVIFASRARLQDNECWANTSGIVLQRDPEQSEIGSEASVTGNRCHANHAGSGIVLFSSSAQIEDNVCWDNAKGGIALERGTTSPDDASHAEITGNRCHDNREGSGIVIISSHARVVNNVCFANAIGGIALQRGKVCPDAASQAEIIGNRLYDNREGAGVVLFSSEALVQDNDCFGNARGIVLHRDPDTLEAASQAQVIGNRCHDNLEGSGILLFSSSAQILDNDCWGNDKAGIALERGRDTAHAASEAELIGNRCYANEAAPGILLSSSRASLQRNECWSNVSGIVLQIDSVSPTAGSEAELIDNRCHGNREGPGVVIISSRAYLRGNECWANTAGIVVQRRDSDTDGAASEVELISNRCHGNLKGSGIALISSHARMEDNECWENSLAGITLQRNVEHPDPGASAAELVGNRCYENRAGVGIHVLSSRARLVENECWANASGIILQRHAGDDAAASEGELLGNRCHGHTLAGIGLAGSDARLDRNYCWDNRFNTPLNESSEPHPPGTLDQGEHFEFEALPEATLEQERRAKQPHRALLEEMPDGANRNRPLADFLWIGADSRSFNSWLGLLTSPPAQESDATHAMAQPLRRFFEVSSAGGALSIRERDKKSTDTQVRIEGLFEDALTALNSYSRHVRSVFTLIDSSGDELKLVERFVDCFPDRIDAIDAPKVRALIKQNSLKCSAPIKLQAGEYYDQESYLFDTHLLDAQPRWRARLRLLWVPALAVVVGLGGLYWVLTDFFGVSLAVRDLVDELNMDTLLYGTLTLIGLPIAGRALANLCLPGKLRFGAPGAFHWLRRIGGLFDFEVFRNVESVVQEFYARFERANWWRWARPLLIGTDLSHPHLVTVLIEGVETWRAEDLYRLRQVLRPLYPDQAIAVILQVTDKAMIPSALLAALYGERDHEFMPAINSDTIQILDCSDRMDLGDLDQHEPTLEVGAVAGQALMAEWVNDQWTLLDLLPTLVLGSLPEAQMRLQYPHSAAFEAVREVLPAQTEDYSELFLGAVHKPYERSTFESLQSAAVDGRGLFLGRSGSDLYPQESIIGRAGLRRNLAAALLARASNPEDRATIQRVIGGYLAAAEWFHLGEALTHLQRVTDAEQPTVGLRHFAWHVRAAGQLVEDRAGPALAADTDAARAIGGRRDHKLLSRWRALFEALTAPSALANPAQLDDYVLESAWCSFFYATDKLLEADVVDAADELSVLAFTQRINSQAAPSHPADSFAGLFERRLLALGELLGNLDTDYAHRLARQKFAQEWHWAPQPLQDCLLGFISARSVTLRELLTRAASVEQLMVVVRNHADFPTQVLAELAVLASRAYAERATRDALCASLANIAQTMDALRERLVAAGKSLTEPEVPARGAGELVAQLFDDPAYRAQLVAALAGPRTSGQIDLAGVAYGSFSPLNREIRAIETVELIRSGR